MIKSKYLLGCDPECFLFRDGEFISGEGIIPGNKSQPYPVDHGAIQLDGLAAEFNIDPVDNPEDWNRNISVVIEQLKEIIHKHDPDIELKFNPVAKFNKKYFLSLSKQSRELGCIPDFNITGSKNPAPNLLNEPIRTASGHIHIGWGSGLDPNDPGHFEDCRFVADYFYNRNTFQSFDTDSLIRLNYYGYQGSFRPKTYGVELRSPDNLWVRTSESRIKMFSKIASHLENF